MPIAALLLAACGMHARAVAEVRVPIAATLRREVQDVVNRAQKIETAFPDVVGHRGVRAVEVTKRAVAFPRENGWCSCWCWAAPSRRGR